MWERNTDEGLFSMKSIGALDAEVSEVAQVLFDNGKYRNQWDVNYRDGYALERIADQAYIIYLKARNIPPFSARDWSMIMNPQITDDGTIYLIFYSYETDLIPEVKSICRSTIPVSLLFLVYTIIDWLLEN